MRRGTRAVRSVSMIYFSVIKVGLNRLNKSTSAKAGRARSDIVPALTRLIGDHFHYNIVAIEGLDAVVRFSLHR